MKRSGKLYLRIHMLIILFLSTSHLTTGQTKSLPLGFVSRTDKVTPVKFGEKVPEILFEQMLNYSKGSAKLSDFRGKLLILDFWSTACPVCIAQFPKMDALQEKYKDKLNIIGVGFDVRRPGEIVEFIEKRRGTTKAITLPTVVIDTANQIMMKLFPFYGLPKQAWIAADGTFIGWTNHLPVNSRNIELALTGASLEHLTVKEWYHPKKEEGILYQQSLRSPVPVFGSNYSGYQAFVKADVIWPQKPTRDSQFYHYYNVNFHVDDFYRMAYEKQFRKIGEKGVGKIIMEDNGKPFYDSYQDIKKYVPENGFHDEVSTEQFYIKNWFSYELLLPLSYSWEEVYDYMIKDFDRIAEVESKIEKRKISGWALVRTGMSNKYQSKVDKQRQLTKDYDDKSRNIIAGRIYTYLGYHSSELANTIKELLADGREGAMDFCDYLDDKTNFAGAIDITIDMGELRISNKPIETMRHQLQYYGLDLVPMEKEMNVLVLYNKRKGRQIKSIGAIQTSN